MTIEKSKKVTFTKKTKQRFNMDDNDVNKISVSKKEQFGKNNSLIYFIGYNDNDVIRSLCLKLSKRLVILMNLTKIKIQ